MSMKIENIGAATMALGGGIRVVKNELLPPWEILIVVGEEAYESIKKSDQRDKQEKVK